MLSAQDVEWLQVALKEIDGLLRGMTDFRPYNDLVNRDDPRLQMLLEQVVTTVRDARTLSSKALTRLDDARQASLEETRLAAEAATRPPVPMVAPTVPTFRPPTQMEQITMANPTGMRELVLVADHDAASLHEIEAMLTDEDYRVLSIRDAFEAISIYARLWAAIDLVVLDFSMPMMSGELIFDELQAINPNVAVVISSGFTHPEKLSQMLARGLSGFLPKPYNGEKLIPQIKQVLAHRPRSGGVSRL